MVDLAKQLLRCVLICVLLYCSRTHHPSTTVLNANKPSTTGYMVAAKCWSRIPAKCCTSACSKSASKSSKSPPTLLPAPSLFLQTKRKWTTTNKAKKNRTNNNSVSTKMAAGKCWNRVPVKCRTSCSTSASKSLKSPPTLLPAPSLFLQTKRKWTTTNKAKKNRTNNNSVSTKMVSLPSQIHQAHSQLLQDKYPRAAVSQFFLTGPLSWLAHQGLNSMT